VCRIKETLRKKFADLANDFAQRLHAISLKLTAIEGPLEVITFLVIKARLSLVDVVLKEQQQQVQQIQTRLPALSDALNNVAKAELECNSANVEENDYTVFTCQDLEFELELVVQSIAKKIAFIDNQVRLRISDR
jgi:hypothetical protein